MAKPAEGEFSDAMAGVFQQNEETPQDDGHADGKSVMDKFRESEGMNKTSSFGIEAYLRNEPGRAFDMEDELHKSKEEREAETEQRKNNHANFLLTIKEVFCSDKSFRWRQWRFAVFTEGATSLERCPCRSSILS